MAKSYEKDGGSGGPGLQDIYLRHEINLTRYSTYEARKLQGILDEANKQIKTLITKAKGVETKAKYRRIASEIKRISADLNKQLTGQLELDFTELAQVETEFVEKAMRTIGMTANFELPAPAKVWVAASFAPYTGYRKSGTYEQYLSEFSNNLYKTWDVQCRAAYLTGMTAAQINKAVLGSQKDLTPGQMLDLKKSLEMNTKTMISSLCETARNETYKQNSGLFSGFKYLATLDSRTCPVCGVLDGNVFKGSEPPTEPKLPQHPNCRCLWLPVIKGLEDDYIEGDERASADGPVPANMTYADWLARQPESVQRDILGPARFDLYKMGKPITTFVTDGRTLTLSQLLEKEGIIRMPASVGAMATRFYVKRPFSVKEYDYHVQEGTYITDVSVFAQGEQIRDVKRLIRENPLPNGTLTKPDDWSKVKGNGYITNGSMVRYAELHWYQGINIGKIEWKVKKYLD